MLQQTRVAAVLDHYARWMERFPTVEALAAAREQSVLAMWSGLGYYHRARRLHQAAKVIVRERKGEFPRTAEEWLELPGIGRYTAAAIASIAFGEAVAVVDGNVERVLARMFGASLKAEGKWQQRRSSARSLPPRRLQPGHDGVGRDDLYATRAAMSPLPVDCVVCDTRRRRAEAAARAPSQAGSLCAGSQGRFDTAGAASRGHQAHGRHVGVPEVAASKAEAAGEVSPFHHGY